MRVRRSQPLLLLLSGHRRGLLQVPHTQALHSRKEGTGGGRSMTGGEQRIGGRLTGRAGPEPSWPQGTATLEPEKKEASKGAEMKKEGGGEGEAEGGVMT